MIGMIMTGCNAVHWSGFPVEIPARDLGQTSGWRRAVRPLELLAHIIKYFISAYIRPARALLREGRVQASLSCIAVLEVSLSFAVTKLAAVADGVRSGPNNKNMTAQLTEEEIGKYTEAFTLFDKDGDGLILNSELGPLLRSVTICPSETEIAKIIEQTLGAEGKVSFTLPEFLDCLGNRKMIDADQEEELVAVFRAFDPERTGFITKAQLRDVMTYIGYRMPEEEEVEMIRDIEDEGCIDVQGRIDYHKYVRCSLLR
jgi:calmodulin